MPKRDAAIERSVKQRQALRDYLHSVRPLAPGWNKDRLISSIFGIERFYVLNSEVARPERRREIRRLAKQLLNELKGLGGLDKSFLDTLGALAANPKKYKKAKKDKKATIGAASAARGKAQGGDHRSGERGAGQSVLAMLIRLYIESTGKSGFSESGPLVRFVNTIGRMILPIDFTNDAVKKELQRVKEKMPKFAVPHTYREQSLEAWELAVAEMISKRQRKGGQIKV
jgi:hypothetical protein